MKKIILICCDNSYVPKSIIALNQFYSYNPDYVKVIIGTTFTSESKALCKKYDIKIIEIDLSNDFIDLDKRPYGKQYPIECFYHFYSYKLFSGYDFIVQIEPDICTNKTIDIDLNSIKFIGGSHAKNYTIQKYEPLMNDYEKIKEIYGERDTNQHRICGGGKIYNIKGLESVKFYEKILDYYQTSIKNGIPRCGDDSLMVMYQMLNPSHITLLNPEFHIIFFDHLKCNIKDITFLHFGGPTQKYWKIKNSTLLNRIQRYFYDEIIEFIYNNFDIEFIKQYVPEIYVDIKNVKIPFYYYNCEVNFGDLITPYLLNKVCDKEDYMFDFTYNNPKIISCGSIMRLCHQKTIVYGSGIRDINQDIEKGIIKIVRGPLTRERLLKIGCYCPPVYGDPGLLLPLYYNPKITKTHKLGIIPHYIHYNKIKKMYEKSKDIKVINLINKDIEVVIDEILSCNKTISSSLHGLIVSDTYGIPNKWVKFDNKINGDDTKYHDYFSSVARCDTDYIDCLEYKKIPDNTYDIISDVNISFDVKNLQQKFFMDHNGIKNYTKYLYCKYLQ